MPGSMRFYQLDRQEIRDGHKGHEMSPERFGPAGPFPDARISDKLATVASKE
jgi:hypothetical protein